FKQFYFTAYKFLLSNSVEDCLDNRAFKSNFYEPVIRSFLDKLESGLDIINYPQHFSMHEQFSYPMTTYCKKTGECPFTIDEAKAIVPEVPIIRHFINNSDLDSLKIPEDSLSRDQVQLKVCVTGPIELYVRTDLGFTIYRDILTNIAKSINAFIKNSIIKDKKIKTKVVVIDEPSIGFIDLFNATDDDLINAFDTALDGLDDDIITQIHLHSLKDAHLALESKNIDVITCEYASDPSNVIEKRIFQEYDKKMRIGICRTNYNAIIGQLYEKGIKVGTSYEEGLKLIDSVDKIRMAYKKAIEYYGRENIQFVGPDCGLSAWNPPKLALDLLKRVVKVGREFEKMQV
ncbi:MAG: hypothetical protein ACTSYS_02920, partial [Promethearchaeota archaeon]